MRVILFAGKGGVGKTSVAAESILSEDPERNLKLLQELIPLYLYGTLGKPGK